MSDDTRPARNPIQHVRAISSRYGDVLGLPGARGFFLSAAVARLGVATTGLGLLWTVHGLTGSFALAGTTTSLFALAEATVGPQAARLIDRYGQPCVLPLALLLHVIGIGIVVGGSLRVAVVPLLVGSLVAGGAIPQPGALSAARWTHLLPSGGRLRTAFSLEAVVNDIVFLSGPPIVALVSGSDHPFQGTALAAALVTAGGIGLAAQRRTAPPARAHDRSRTRRRPSTLLRREFLSTFGVTLGLGLFFGAIPLIVTAYSTERGFGPAAGLMQAITSVASLVSGIAYGAMGERWPPWTVQLAASLLLVVAIAATTVWLSVPALLIGLALAGSSIAPLNVSSAQVVEQTVPREALTQAFTWINTASAGGIAVAGALIGFVVQDGGVRPALLACCILASMAPLSAVVGKPRRATPVRSPGR